MIAVKLNYVLLLSSLAILNDDLVPAWKVGSEIKDNEWKYPVVCHHV